MKFAYLIEPPFNYRDEDGMVAGCDVELARYVFAKLGIDVFEPVQAEFADLLPGVAAGRWRMTTGLFGTEERLKVASFSQPIWALPDGLLVAKGNPLALRGYESVAAHTDCILAVIRDQFQHQSAIQFKIPEDRISVFETYTDAAFAVRNGHAGAYASVGRAHLGFIERNPDWRLELLAVPEAEKEPAFGSFAFDKADREFRNDVNRVLGDYLGSPAHRSMMFRYGFSDAEIDILIS